MSRSSRPDTGQRREELLEAARLVIARDGVPRTTTRAIATQADVPLGTVHYWFASKDDLLEAVVLDHVARITAAASEAGGDDDVPLEDRVEGSLRAALGTELAYSVPERLSTYELAAWALRTPGREGVAQRLYAAMREGALALCEPVVPVSPAPGTPDAETVATLLAALVDGLALARLADPEGTRVDDVVRLASRALAAVLETPSG